MTADILTRLQQIVGEKGLVTGEDVRSRSDVFFGVEPCQALAIVRPATTEEVSQTLSLCNELGQVIVPVGGWTGLVHGVKAGPSELLLSLERMTAIEEFDAQSGALTVQAGATLQSVQEYAAEHGLNYPMDLGGRGSATIGGNIACNAGGNRVIRYGMTRDQVLGLEVVRADGAVLSSLSKLMKNNTGYDLKHLFIGSEGTLGVVTRATLRLRPAPRSSNVAFIATSEFSSLLKILPTMQEAMGGALSAFEVMWREFYTAVLQGPQTHTPPLPDGHNYYALVEYQAGGQSNDEVFEAALMQLFEAGLVEDIAVAKSDGQKEAIWAIRDDVIAVIVALGAGTRAYDVSLPRPHMEAYTTTLKQELARVAPEKAPIIFGHLGDGNLHIAVAGEPGNEDMARRIDDVVYGPLGAIGGSVSAEHGIGLDKKPYLTLSRSPAEVETMRLIKQALDPKGILNPGKIFDAP